MSKNLEDMPHQNIHMGVLKKNATVTGRKWWTQAGSNPPALPALFSRAVRFTRLPKPAGKLVDPSGIEPLTS
jgi:hypothetical protein